jgi:hypothetical protein
MNKDFNDNFELVEYNSSNIKLILDDFEEFKDLIDYSNLNDFNTIIYNDKNYIIKTWKDLFNFVAGRI